MPEIALAVFQAFKWYDRKKLKVIYLD